MASQLQLFDNPPSDADVQPAPPPVLTSANVRVPFLTGQDDKSCRELTRIIDEIWTHTRDVDLLRRCCRIWWQVLRRYEDGEAPYMEAIAPWKDMPDVLQLVSRGFGVLTRHFWLDGFMSDVLAPVKEHFEAECLPRKKKDTAYFHTPLNVARMSAWMLIDDDSEEIERRLKHGPPITVQDPACGTGMLLLAFRSVVAERYGRKALRMVRCYGQDIDETGVLATRIQLRMSNADWMTSFQLAFLGEVQHAQGAA